ncbi:pyridoxamine 5-phosphate oxidase [Gammaproteobacteria bacterium 50_400_T64]|nr:pyridoxamine 5-phosphate oxidase [Gammaproteobacteria bacterium 50_400_T64]
MWNIFKKQKNNIFPGSDGEHIIQKNFNTDKKALSFYNKQVINELAPLMIKFIEAQEMAFIATSDKKGECDCSFRAGPAGFIKIVNNKTIIYPEYRGNGVMASMGNIYENKNIGLFFIDFYRTAVGLHVNGTAEFIKKEDLSRSLGERKDIVSTLQNTESLNKVIGYVLIDVEEAYIHCSKHIPLLQKIDKKIHWSTDSELHKGGDAFQVKNHPRPWSKA